MRAILKFLLIIFLFSPLSVWAFTIGATSDLHAGEGGLSNVDKIFEDTAKTLEKKGADIIIVAGDMISKGKGSYAAGIKNVSQEVDIPILWVKGNHDKKDFKVFSSETNYFRDFGNWRIVVLDSNGGFSKGELSFLKKSLNTDKDVIIAMHHPVLKRKNLTTSGKQKKFMKALTPNVKTVLSGHWHESWKKERNGIFFEGLPKLEKGKYKMIDL